MIAFEKSAGAVVFRKTDKGIKYLLLKYRNGHWDFPKGHIENGETEEETMRREVREETGIDDLKIVPGFIENFRYVRNMNEEKLKEEEL
jgi:bis(5'-nucleosidyl)-tetraphosphatase